MKTSDVNFYGAEWICPHELGDAPVNTYVEFRRSVRLPEFDGSEGARLKIAADTAYAVWVNGSPAGAGGFPDVPPERQFDDLDVARFLRRGTNSLRIVLYIQGADSFQHIPGDAGVLFCLTACGEAFVSGPEVSWRVSPCYHSGKMPRRTSQLGFTFEYDSRREQCDSGWKKICEKDFAPERRPAALIPRRTLRPESGPPCRSEIAAQGILFGKAGDSPSDDMQTAAMAARTPRQMFGGPECPELPSACGIAVDDGGSGADGVYVVADLGRETVGYLYLELDAAAGAIVDAGHGEHLDDLRVRAHVGDRNFCDRIIWGGGRRVFTHWYGRIAGRYIQLNIRGGGRVRIFAIGIVPVEYPAAVRGSFHASDGLAERIFSTSARTLRLCMHEHYEDCPWREQSLYANDARNQALSGYYALGEYAFPAASFELLGRGLGGDGWLEMCMPARISITIPSFTFCWILGVRDLWMYGGSRYGAHKLYGTVKRILESRASEMTSNDLLPCPAGERYWQFYDWAPGLSGSERIYPGEKRYDAALNLFFCLALEAGVQLAAAAGDAGHAAFWASCADRVRAAAFREFWSPEEGVFVSYRGDKSFAHKCELVQALALLARAAPRKEARDRIVHELLSGDGLVKTTLSQSLYKYEALLSCGKDAVRFVFGSVMDTWGSMLARGATSFWETIRGASDFEGAGSLCHGWSAIPAYIFGAYVLGIRPAEPGYGAVCVMPADFGLESASGTVCTPHGPIRVQWSRPNGVLSGTVWVPRKCRCIAADGIEVVCRGN